MKNLILSLLALVSVPLFSSAQSTVYLSYPIQVANNADFGRTRPRITLNGAGEPVVMWGRTSTNQVYVSRLGAGSQTFSTPVKVTPNGIEAFVASWAGPDIASYGDTVYVAYHSTPEATGKSYVHRSTDGGLTFGDSVRVDHPTVDQSRFPTVSVTEQGNPMVGFMKFEGNWIDPQYSVANSYDNGMSFELDVVASELAPGEVCDCCPAQVANSGNDQVMMFRNNDGDLRDNWVSFSENSGQTFETTLDVDINDWIINSCPSSGPDGFYAGDTLYTVWMSEGSGEIRVNIASVNKNDGEVGYSGNLLPWSLPNGNENFPRIDGEGQTMGVVFQGWNDGNTDCFITVSTTGIAGFTDTVKLGGIDTDGLQRGPDVAYENGVFHTVYEDIDSGHLMYQAAAMSDVSISELSRELNAWNSSVGEITFRLHSSQSFELELIDTAGRTIQRKRSVNDKDLISGLESGLYLVIIRTDDGVSSKKVFVQ